MFDCFEELADLVVLLEGVAERAFWVEHVVIASTDLFAADVTRFLEIRHDADGGPLGDADQVGDVAQAQVGVLGDRQEDVSVVGQERPLEGYLIT